MHTQIVIVIYPCVFGGYRCIMYKHACMYKLPHSVLKSWGPSDRQSTPFTREMRSPFASTMNNISCASSMKERERGGTRFAGLCTGLRAGDGEGLEHLCARPDAAPALNYNPERVNGVSESEETVDTTDRERGKFCHAHRPDLSRNFKSQSRCQWF